MASNLINSDVLQPTVVAMVIAYVVSVVHTRLKLNSTGDV